MHHGKSALFISNFAESATEWLLVNDLFARQDRNSITGQPLAPAESHLPDPSWMAVFSLKCRSSVFYDLPDRDAVRLALRLSPSEMTCRPGNLVR